MKSISIFFKSILGALIIAGSTLPALADVKITYSPSLEKRLEAISFAEGWKKNWPTTKSEEEPFSVSDILTYMFERGVKEANPDFDGDVLVHVTRLGVPRHSVALLRTKHGYMEGTVILIGTDGNLIAERKISAQPVRRYTSILPYRGRHYPFPRSIVELQVGPTFAAFSQKALEKIFPDYDAPGLILW